MRIATIVLCAVAFGSIYSGTVAHAEPRTSNFKLEAKVVENDPSAFDKKIPSVYLLVRYVGDGQIKVAPLWKNSVVLGAPHGWKSRKRLHGGAFFGSMSPDTLAKGGQLFSVTPLGDYFAKITPGTFKVPIRVRVQPVEGEDNLMARLRDPSVKSTLRRLKPIILTGFVTVTIKNPPPSKSRPPAKR